MSEESQFKKMTRGDRLRWIIEHRGYTQVQLAKKCGITQAAISNIVTDSSRKPSAPTLLRLVEALEMNPDWFFTGEGSPSATGLIDEDERALVRAFRQMDKSGRMMLLAASKAYVQKS